MADVEEGKPTDGPNEYENMNDSAQQDELKEVKAHLISANGGAGGDTSDPTEYKVAIVEPSSSSDGEVSFSGLGKDEVLKYANDPFWVRLRWILFILFWVGWIAMLVTAITIIVLAPRCPPRPDLKWYNTDTVYQVVVKSFKDSNNDGYGDFKGLTDKLSYITDDIGAKAIWLDSIYKYDGEDYSLGILDHKDLDDKLEVKLDDFKNWLKKMRKEGKKIILDLIPNQSSKNHSWFQKSRLNDSHFGDYYIWKNGSPNNPPTDQKNKYGDSAWSYDLERKAWYFHQYSKDYPDLNLKSEAVRKEFKDIMKFWFEAGVSGFHIKGLESAYNNDTLAFVEVLRAVADEYSDKPGREKLLFGSVRNGQDISEYWGTNEKKRLHIVVPVMEELKDGCKADCAKALVEKLNINVTNHWAGLQLGNQETQRVATRLGGDYKKRLMQAHALQLLLLGTPFNYYGDEFGQRDGDAQTSVKFHGNEVHMTPMQWNTLVNAGFTDQNVSTWIPVGSNYKLDNVQVGLAHFSGLTPLEAYMQLSKLRTRESFQWGTTKVSAPNEDLLVFTRQATRFPYFLVLMNLSDQEIHVSPEDLREFSIKEGTVRYHTRMEEVDKSISFLDKGANLQGYDVIVLELPALD